MAGDDISIPAPLPTCAIILVHGTWGRGLSPSDPFVDTARNLPGNTIPRPRWFDLASEFCSQIEGALHQTFDVVFEAFHWSGSNSIFSRNDAAISLCERLKALEPQFQQLVIIAHSHGGNVALRALELLGSGARRVRLVTLATPFVRLRAIEATPNLTFYMFLLLALFIASLGSFGRLLLPPLPNPTDPAFAHAAESAIATIFQVVMPASLILSIVVSWIATRYLLNLSSKGNWGGRPERLAQAAYFETNSLNAPQMLVLRGVDDEAGFALSAGALGSRLSFLFVTKWIPRLFFRAAVGLLLIVFMGWATGLTEMSVGGYIWIMYVLSTSLGVMLVLPGLFKSVFGKELLFGSLRCEIAVDSSPDGADRIEVATLSLNPIRLARPLSWTDIPFATWLVGLVRRLLGLDGEKLASPPSNLRHAIYDDHRAPEYITSWILRNTADIT